MRLRHLLATTAVVLPVALGGCSALQGSTAAAERTTGAGGAPRTAHERAVEHYRAGHYGLAVEAFRKAVETAPASVASLNGLAASYDKLQRYDLAVRYYHRALAHAPASAQTLNNLGYSYILQGRYDVAFAYLAEAQRNDVDNPVLDANLTLAEGLLEAKGRLAYVSGSDGGERAERVRPAAATAADTEAKRALRLVRRTAQVQRLVRDEAAAPAPGPAAIQAARAARPAVLALRTAPAEAVASAAPVLEIANGAGRDRMAARMRAHLRRHGVRAARLTNADDFDYEASAVLYRDGWRTWAEALVDLLPGRIGLEQVDEQFADVKLRLGADLLAFDATLPADHGAPPAGS